MKKILYISFAILLTCFPVLGQDTTTPFNSTTEDYDYLFMQAVQAKMNGDLEDAVQLLQRCIDLKPDTPTPYVQLSEIMLAGRNISSALELSKKAVELGGDNQMYLLNLARTYQAAQMPDSSLVIYNNLALKYPDNLDIKLGQVSLYFELKKFKEALPLLDTIQNSAGYVTEIVLAKCQALVVLERQNEAIQFLNEAIQDDPNNPYFLGTLAEVYHTMKKDKEALEVYNKLEKEFPDFVSGKLSFIDFYKELSDYDGIFRIANEIVNDTHFEFDSKWELLLSLSTDKNIIKSHNDKLLTLINTVESQYPNYFQIKLLKIDFYLRNQQYNIAKDELLAITAVNKDNYTLWAQLGYVLNQTKDFDIQIKSMTEAISLFKEQVPLYVYKSFAESQKGDYQTAIKTLKTALNYLGNEKEDQAEIYSMLGDFYSATKDYSLSDEFYQLALDLYPENPYTLNNYAYHLSERGENLDMAKKYILMCLDMVEDNATYLDTAAWVFYRMGDKAKALDYIFKTFKLGSKEGLSPEIYAHYIEILLANGNKKEAKSVYKYLKKDETFISTPEYKQVTSLIKHGI